MTKFELVEKVAVRHGLTWKLSEEIVSKLFDDVGAAVNRDGRFMWPGFGVWTVRHRKARMIRNPQTGGLMQLPKTVTIGFRTSKELKASLGSKKKRRAA